MKKFMALLGISLAVAAGAEVQVRLEGPVAKKMDALFLKRVFGSEAQGRIYDEAVNAFRTHYDDTRTGDMGWTKGKGLWQGEYWGKTMLSSAVVCEYAGDARLKEWLRTKARAFVKEFQQSDGYHCSYKERTFVGGPDKSGREVFCWNLWGRKYTMWALIELARVTEAPDLLEAAAKMMDQEIDQLEKTGVKIEQTGYFVGLPSMSVLKPLLVLYRATKKPAYLAFARQIVAAWEREGNPAPNLIANAFSGKPVHEWYPQPAWWAKAYEMMSCLEGLIDFAGETNAPRVLEAVRKIVAQLEGHELNVLGSVGFFDHFTNAAACPNATTEPCDVTHWIRVNRDLFLATDDAHYLDNVEFAFYNAFLAGVYRDGKWGAHSVRSHGSRHRTAPHQVGMKYHQCCVDNMPRTFVDFAATAVTCGKDGVVSVNLYSPLKARAGQASVVIDGNYPVGDEVKVKVAAEADVKVRLRVPGWFDAVEIDGEKAKGPWRAVTVPKGEKTFAVRFFRTPKLVNSKVKPGADPRRRAFEEAQENPDMTNLSRLTPAAHLVYGPLLLAKSKRVTEDAKTILDKDSVNGRNFTCTLEPVDADGVWGAWEATLTDGVETIVRKVCDFASAADADDPSNLFSIWF